MTASWPRVDYRVQSTLSRDMVSRIYHVTATTACEAGIVTASAQHKDEAKARRTAYEGVKRDVRRVMADWERRQRERRDRR